MKCPRCGADNDKVIDTRPSDEGRAIRRRRVCIDKQFLLLVAACHKQDKS